MLPVVAEIVLVEKLKPRICAKRETEIAKPDLGRLAHPWAIGIFLEVFGSANDQTADHELVKVAVGPPEGGLQHLVGLREIEVAWQLRGPADGRLDPDNLGFDANDKILAIKALC